MNQGFSWGFHVYQTIKSGFSKRQLLSLINLALFSWFLTTTIFAQSVNGISAPSEKNTRTLTAREKVTRGEAPLGLLNEYLLPAAEKIERLPALDTIPQEKKDGFAKRLQVGVTRPLGAAEKLQPLIDGAMYPVAGGEVRVLGIVSSGALATRVKFENLALPEGARLYVYALGNREEFYAIDPSAAVNGVFWSPPVTGEAVGIEYFAPARNQTENTADAPFTVTAVSHIFRSTEATQALAPTTVNAAGSCNIDVTPEWAEPAKATGYLQFNVPGEGDFICTGTLLNTANNSLTPYLLTANHCFDSQASAQSLRVSWNYNTGEFPSGTTPRTDGATLLATNSDSDFTFVRLTGTVPGGLYYMGWDATSVGTGVGVTDTHHPQGSHKRISFGSTITAPCPAGYVCSYFLPVRWNTGTTEGGSSGSGLLTGSAANPKLVGTLTGGIASCGNPSGQDYFGRFSVMYPQLQQYLNPQTNVQFASANTTASEASSATLTVTRTGDTSGTMTVGYRTQDGSALQRTDYIVTAGTLTFAPNETSKTIIVALTADGYGEGNETFSVVLENLAGATFGGTSTATVTISDAGATAVNPIDDARNFVRQQYLDFLSRTPDAGGWDYWTSQITQCGGDANCINGQRIGVSSTFFIELEFQESGGYVYRLYKSAFGEAANYRPTYAQFAPDRARVVGGSNLAQGKLDFANQFIARGEFLARYPASLNSTQFVDAILATVQQGAGVSFTTTERQNFINDVNNGGRGLMLRSLADNQAFSQAIYNRAFVLMQYFGYLRRDPDQGGYDYWLSVLNATPGTPAQSSRLMVCNFLTAQEYQERFSPTVSRNNQICASNP